MQPYPAPVLENPQRFNLDPRWLGVIYTGRSRVYDNYALGKGSEKQSPEMSRD